MGNPHPIHPGQANGVHEPLFARIPRAVLLALDRGGCQSQAASRVRDRQARRRIRDEPLEWAASGMPRGHARVPLLGNAEKAELERLILVRLQDHYETHGSGALLAEGLRVVVNGAGIELDRGETPDPLAAVEVRSLFTALCYVTGGTMGLPREGLEPLATEATSALAAQINRIVPD